MVAISARDKHWHKVFDINLHSIFYATRAAIPHLALRKGTIVSKSSLSGVRGDYGSNGYYAAKAGVINLTRSLALEHGAGGHPGQMRQSRLHHYAMQDRTPDVVSEM
ncbi:Short-chain dehydrogenase/reductase SDR [Sphingobium herbicidovorans NBRC 16415]|uniref:Short-chain dehydrogenase/reductase SDR n=1 Tax=Sphingobium herbicidovorans (strain ATCC 700291 / DSM 11019 / CCUG 56400 / KCTC 2939 / LMG 18315 / NBRC 16415 / MH) TaxID=1219045 RepID=A0A086PA93_SPHHM|nr:Short-chain dehydrogenase/reductase SDR [Sphingobium herbicidovorans NBRC 16415]